MISNANMLTITDAGFSYELYRPLKGAITIRDRYAYDEPSELQIDCAHRLFISLFIQKNPVAHIAAEMQSGKTGVMTSLIRMIRANESIPIGIDDISIITGMSDCDWVSQTKSRLPFDMRQNVYHNKTVTKLDEVMNENARRNNGIHNMIFFIDESHIASNCYNQIGVLFQKIVDQCPESEWANRNIRVVSISATDPATIVSTLRNVSSTAIVRLCTNADYQSVASLLSQNRIHPAEDLQIEENVQQLYSFITTTYYTPKWHIIRMSTTSIKYTACKHLLQSIFIDAPMITWDQETQTGDINNELLHSPPSTHSFILIKNMFSASKTLNTQHVGVLYERKSQTQKDCFTLQSLLGRLCGYGRSPYSHVFTQMTSVNRYINVWRDLSTFSISGGFKLSRQMPGLLYDEGQLCSTNERINIGHLHEGLELSTHEPVETDMEWGIKNLHKNTKNALARNKDTLVVTLIRHLIVNREASFEQLKESCKIKSKNDFITWQKQHGRYKIIIQCGTMFTLNPEIDSIVLLIKQHADSVL